MPLTSLGYEGRFRHLKGTSKDILKEPLKAPLENAIRNLIKGSSIIS